MGEGEGEASEGTGQGAEVRGVKGQAGVSHREQWLPPGARPPTDHLCPSPPLALKKRNK